MERARSDVAEFIDRHVIIDEVLEESTSTRPFRLWPDQRDALRLLHSERLVVFLKARQLGITWLCLAYALWLMLTRPGRVVILISQGQKEADEMIRRVRAMFGRLPAWMLAGSPHLVRENTSELGWSNGSRCEALPATENAGRSFTASLVIMDEAAHQKWGGKLYSACKPTIDAGGKLFVVSSANGSDGFFDRLWKKAVGIGNGFRAIFLPWSSRPDRDEAWYRRQEDESTDPELVKQEYPRNPTEAFINSGRARFHRDWLVAQEEYIADPSPDPAVPGPLRKVDGLHFFSMPAPGLTYAVCSDVSEGLPIGDNSTAVVACLETGEEVASLVGRPEPDELAVALFRLGCYYNAPIAVERNNHGHAVLLRLSQLVAGVNVPAGLLDPHGGRVPPGVWIVPGEDERSGWLTNARTKPLAVDALAESLRDMTIYLRNRTALGELQDYLVLKGGRTGAAPGSHDDFVTAWFIFCGVRPALIGRAGQLAF